MFPIGLQWRCLVSLELSTREVFSLPGTTFIVVSGFFVHRKTDSIFTARLLLIDYRSLTILSPNYLDQIVRSARLLFHALLHLNVQQTLNPSLFEEVTRTSQPSAASRGSSTSIPHRVGAWVSRTYERAYGRSVRGSPLISPRCAHTPLLLEAYGHTHTYRAREIERDREIETTCIYPSPSCTHFCPFHHHPSRDDDGFPLSTHSPIVFSPPHSPSIFIIYPHYITHTHTG